jgi:hypothetical protein
VGNGWLTEFLDELGVEAALGNAVVAEGEETKTHEPVRVEAHARTHVERHVDLVRG